MKKQLATAFALAFAASTLALGGTASAESTDSVEAAAVPTCVATRAWSDFPRQYARATNNCSSSQRLYFRWDRAVDGGCTTLGARGGWREEWRVYQARFAGLSSC